MPLNQTQIEKLKKIPNRVSIYGPFTTELRNAQRDIAVRSSQQGINETTTTVLQDFVEEYKDTILKMPLSSLRNELGYNLGKFYISSQRYLLKFRNVSLVDITPDRVVAGFVTSGTGIMTDRYATDTEIIFIEDETGSIGVILENELTRGIVVSGFQFSIGTANSKPIVNGGHQIGGNIPANDYRHNIRIGDMVVIQKGTYEPGIGYVLDGDIFRPNQGPPVIHGVSQYVVDSELRGISPLPFNERSRVEVNPLNSRYDWETWRVDNHLISLRGEFEFVDIPYFSSEEYKPLSGNDLIFLPNKVYNLRIVNDDLAQKWTHQRSGGILRVVISQTTELARFGVKIPTGRFNYISGIFVQDSYSDERLLFPRFFGDIYPQESNR